MDVRLNEPKRGILLFDSNEKIGLGDTNSQPPSSQGSGRARNTPFEVAGIRTNFTTSNDTTPTRSLDAPTQLPFDSDSPILEEYEQAKTPGRHYALPPPPSFSSWGIFLGSLLGIGIGFALYFLHIGPEWLKLVSLLGDLFLRGLQCLIVPMVFCVMTVVVAETVSMGRTSVLRWQTVLPYAFTSLLATLQGLVLALMFRTMFTSSAATTIAQAKASSFNLTMQCANGMYLTAGINGSMACSGSNITGSSLFFAMNQSVGSVSTGLSNSSQLSLMDQMISITNLMVPVNIFASLAEGSLLSIVLFAAPLGWAVAHSASDGRPNIVLQLVRQQRNIFLVMLNGLLSVTPIAVVFLMASAIARFSVHNLSTIMTQMGYLVVALVIGVACHAFVVLPTFLYAMTRRNPFAYIQHLFPAYVFAFGCASSMATLPVAIACIQKAQVSRTLAQIAMPFGTPVNLNACGLYYPLAVVFMANVSDMGDQLTAPRYAVLFFVSLLGCMGTAPVPNGSLIYLMTVWKTVFPNEPLPQAFAFVVAADFLLDRICTMLNVNGNAIVTRILADQTDEAFEVQAAQHV